MARFISALDEMSDKRGARKIALLKMNTMTDADAANRQS